MHTRTLLSKWRGQSQHLLGLLRLITAFLFIQFGTAKLLGVPAPVMPDGSTAQLMSQAGVAGLLEMVGGALIFVGLFTRPVAFILSGEMAFAYFIGHAPQGFWPVLNQGTPAVLFCFLFLYFSAAGPGAFSVSNAIRRPTPTIAGFGGHPEPVHHSR